MNAVWIRLNPQMLEYGVLKSRGLQANPRLFFVLRPKRSVRLTARTLVFQAGNRGSIPLRTISISVCGFLISDSCQSESEIEKHLWCSGSHSALPWRKRGFNPRRVLC
jgi:hypothetical protein